MYAPPPLYLLLAAIALLTPLPSQAQIEGKYTGLYAFYSKSLMPADLILEKTKDGFEGKITFSHFEHVVGAEVVRSSFATEATYDSVTKAVRFVFAEWIDAPAFGDFDLGARAGRLEINGSVLSGDGFDFALEESPEIEHMQVKQKLFEAQAMAQRRVNDDYMKRAGSYEQQLADEIAKGPPPGPEPVGRRRRR